MEEPIRVLLVERPERGIARQLLANYDLDFSWVSASSAQHLVKLAADFNPHIVLCSEYLSPGSSHALIDALRLLCASSPSILVSNVRDSDETSRRMTDVFLNNLRPPESDSTRPAEAEACRSDLDVAQLRQCFSQLLESSTHPAVMTDADGWVTFANTSACRALGGHSERYLATLLDPAAHPYKAAPNWLDVARDANLGFDQYSGPLGIRCGKEALPTRIHPLAYFDAGAGLPTPIHVNSLLARCGAIAGHSAMALAITNLGSARITDETSSFSLSEADPSGAGAEPPSEFPTFGSVVRITPSDYLVALPDPCSAAEAAFTAQRVLESIEETHRPDTFELIPEVGIVAPPPPRVQPKSCGANGIRVRDGHAPGLERDLQDALRRRALSIEYQPQYELDTGRGCGVEALARWVLATGHAVSPSKFIAIAEHSGMIRELGAWMLRSACETAATWCTRTAPLSTLAVNVSALQIDEQFTTLLRDTLKHTGFPAKQLELEITESALIKNTDLTIAHMQDWKQLGVRIAVDDFGTGYSSLNYLARLPIDRLKLDQSLVQMMTRDPKSAAVMRSIVTLGAELGIDVIAEGVETEQQFQMLSRFGCPRVQGYLLGRPMSARQAQVVLRKEWGNRPRTTFTGANFAAAAREAHHVH